MASLNSNKKSSLSSGFLLVRYCAWLERFHVLVLAVSLAAALAGFYYSGLLYKNLRTDMEELLPATAQSVKDLKSVIGKIGGLNHLSIVIQSDNIEAGRKLQRDVAESLEKLPKEMVARVTYNIRAEKKFFSENKSLYVDYKDWDDINRYVRDRVRFERKGHNPFSLGLDENAPQKPEFDFEALKKKYADRSSAYDRFPDGLFEARDGKTHVVLAFLPGKVTDMSKNKELSVIGHKIVESLNPKSYAPDMVVGYDGDVQNVVEEHDGLIEDLVTSFVVVTLLVGVAMLLYFKSFAGVYALCASLFAGVAWTFGLSYWLVGYLNANTAFLGSIVIGNGINFGIILLARYLEERRKGLSGKDALPRSVGFTTQATWTAAIAAGASYASLVLTDFRGFSQFGIIGGIGMALCWVSSFTTLPALLIWLENRGWMRVRMGTERHWAAGLVAKFIVKFHKPLVALTVFSIFASAVLVARLSSDTLESDFSKLSSKHSMEHGSIFWGKKVDAVFERYLTPTVVLAENARDAERLTERLQEVRSREGEASPIAEIRRVEDFLPSDQSRKIRIIEDIKHRLTPTVLRHLSDEDRKLVDELLPTELPKPLVLGDLPEGVVYHFKLIDGQIGRLVHVYPKLASDQNTWNGKEVLRFADRIREGVKNAAVPSAIAGQPPLSADMITAISSDGPKATAAAFLAVMVLVLIVFPRWEYARSILAALLLGVLWMAGIMVLFNLKVNFLNFIALPITFGIGVDYAVNIVSRYRLDGSRSISRVIENTGGAVALCSFTTITGYSSLLLASSQAFVSFGRLAVLGEITCLTAALIALPAVWHFYKESHRDEEIAHSATVG